MSFYKNLTRKKSISDPTPTKLAKVLTAFDLTTLGIGSTLGVGVYVLAGEVSRKDAGPGVVISFLIAAIASVFAGLCYAEFGARVPKAGSAYVYCYVTIGEFIAFLIGWNLILEYAIGGASVVKGLSTYVNSLTGNSMHGFLTEWMPINVHGLSDFVDIFAFSVTLLFSMALAFGAKESSMVNNIFTFVNLSVVLFVIIVGSFKANPSNWQTTVVPENCGTGGFAPYGIAGIFKGAATCFYGFIGFDCIATAGEEAKNPKKSIPIAIIVSLLIIFLAYFGISTVLTMMLPYYQQDVAAPLPYVFEYYDMMIPRYIVSFGAVFGLCASLMGSMFPLPRIVYALSSDGLIFKWMGAISPRFQTPMYGTMFVGTLTGLLATFLNLSELVNMMSIGTLMAYTIVAACVLLLRYEVENEDDKLHIPAPFLKNIFQFLWNTSGVEIPTKLTSIIVTWEVTVFCAISLTFALLIQFLSTPLYEGVLLAWIPVVSVGLLTLMMLVLISRQPVARRFNTFSVPFIPWLPGISILINLYLIVLLDYMTWVRFAIWILIGLIIYFTYGIKNSYERKRYEQQKFLKNQQNENKIFGDSRQILVPTGQ